MEIFREQKRGALYRLIVPATCFAGGCLYELQRYEDNGWWKYVRSFPTKSDAKQYLKEI